MTADRRRHAAWRWSGVLAGLVVLAAPALLFAAPATPAVPSVTLTVKTAADTMYVGEPLVLFAVIENQSDSPLVGVKAAVVTDRFTVEPGPAEAGGQTIAARASTVTTFTVRAPSEQRPGKYTILVTADYGWRLGTAVGGPARLIKDLTLDLKDPSGAGAAAPTVAVTARLSSDTLREGGTLDAYVFVENKSAIPLEGISITVLPPPAVKVAAPATIFTTLTAFSTGRGTWKVALDPEARQGLKYGKHTLIFEVAYRWRYGAAPFESRAVAPIEFSATFFGAEGFSQVFGIPLNLIVFVLPGFCLLFTYGWLTKKLLQTGEAFTPTTKDGIFYSVVWSVFLIFLYRIVGRDLYAFFTSVDLALVSALGIVLGAIVPLVRGVVRSRRTGQQERLRFAEDDAALTVIEKALHRRLDPERYEEVTVKEAEVVWRGILLSKPGEPLALGAQIQVRIPQEEAERLRKSLPALTKQIAAFIARLDDLRPDFAIASPITAGGSAQTHLVKLITNGTNLTLVGTQPLWDIAYKAAAATNTRSSQSSERTR